MFSLGTGWYPAKKTELKFSVGYTPPPYGNIWTTNVLITYSFLKISLNSNLKFEPFKTGIFLNTSYGKNIHLVWPSHYPDNYYWWSSSLRVGPLLESEITYESPKLGNDYSFFFQCLTNDLYIASYVVNTDFVSFGDILILGFGIKYIF